MSANAKIINELGKTYLMTIPFPVRKMDGEIIREMTVKNQAECQNACLINEQCLFGNYNQDTKLCSLNGLAITPGATTSVKAMNTYNVYPDAYLVGQDIMDPLSIQESSCQELCTNDPNCQAYTFMNNMCSLKSYSNDPSMTVSQKLVKMTTPVDDPVLLNNMHCCMNTPSTNLNCSEYQPFTDKCDVFMKSLCETHPQLDACACLNRANNFRYKNVKQKLTEKLGSVQDECWYPACSPGSRAYIPTDMLPISVNFYNDGELVKINNLKCTNSNVCDTPNIVDPELQQTCRAFKLMQIGSTPPIDETTTINTNGVKITTVVQSDGNIIEGFSSNSKTGGDLLFIILILIIIVIIIKLSS